MLRERFEADTTPIPTSNGTPEEPAKEAVGDMLRRIIANLMYSPVLLPEVTQQMERWEEDLLDNDCGVCGDIVAHLDDTEWWGARGWPATLREAVIKATELASRAASPEDKALKAARGVSLPEWWPREENASLVVYRAVHEEEAVKSA